MNDVAEHVLVTGAAGNLGRAVTEHLRAQGFGVTALVLDDPGDLDVDRVVVGNAADREVVVDALDGVDAVAHLAALPAPFLGTPEEVFVGNTAATFTVLDAAGERGIRRAAIASSVNAMGLGWSSRAGVRPRYLPIDEDHPSRPAEPYSLSKQVDEATAAAMARQHGMTVVALRLPYSDSQAGGAQSRLRTRAAKIAADPGMAAPELWLYLDARDAARAFEQAIGVAEPGAHAVLVANGRTLAPYRTEDLLAAFHPTVPLRRPLPGRTAPVLLSRARHLLGFAAEFHLPDDEIRDLPPELLSPEMRPR